MFIANSLLFASFICSAVIAAPGSPIDYKPAVKPYEAPKDYKPEANTVNSTPLPYVPVPPVYAPNPPPCSNICHATFELIVSNCKSSGDTYGDCGAKEWKDRCLEDCKREGD